MRILKLSTVPLSVLFIINCSSGTPPTPPPGPPPPPTKTVFDPLTHTLDRARDVQNTVDQNSDSTRRAVDNQERGDTPP
jgi:hypothetical protein